MAKYKGTNIDALRQSLRKMAPAVEAALLGRLSPADAQVYKTALPISWVPIDAAATILSLAAPLVFPGAPNALRSLGEQQAQHNLNFVYRSILTVATPDFAISQSARLWSIHFDTGKASGQVVSKTEGILLVEEFPDLPAPFLDIVAGYIAGVIACTKTRILRLSIDASSLNALRWRFTWE